MKKMKDNRWRHSMHDLGNALDRLGEILDEPLDAKPYVIDAAIHRFEFVIELYWKTLKYLLAREAIITSTPRESLQKAYKAGWINNEDLWLDMIDDRNLTSHTYREPTALEVYEDIKVFYPVLQETYGFLKNRFLQVRDGE